MKYERNSKIFEKIDSEEKAYWLGFLYADGYVDPIKGELILGLGQKDEEHIVKFQNFLATDAPYQDKINNNNRPYRFFRLYDKRITEDLGRQGLYAKKSLSLEPKMDMDDKWLVPWSRGLFDGDGSIYPQKNSANSIRYRMSLTGTESILLFAQQIWGIEKKLDRYSSVPKFTVAGKGETRKVLELLYGEATIYLDRKYELAKEAIRINLL